MEKRSINRFLKWAMTCNDADWRGVLNWNTTQHNKIASINKSALRWCALICRRRRQQQRQQVWLFFAFQLEKVFFCSQKKKLPFLRRSSSSSSLSAFSSSQCSSLKSQKKKLSRWLSACGKKCRCAAAAGAGECANKKARNLKLFTWNYNERKEKN